MGHDFLNEGLHGTHNQAKLSHQGTSLQFCMSMSLRIGYWVVQSDASHR